MFKDLKRFGFLAIVSLLIVSVFGLYLKDRSYKHTILELQNTIAERDKTIEVKDGLYAKMAIQTEEINKLLDSKDKQVIALNEQLKKTKSELLSVVAVNVKLKEVLNSKADSTEVIVVDETTGKQRTKVEFKGDFKEGLFIVDGTVMTNPPDVSLTLTQGRPFKLQVAISQDSNGKWKAHALSDELSIDVALAAVNPHVVERRWYEKLRVNGSVGISKGTALAGVGVSYEIGKFDLGPSVWTTLDKDIIYGATFGWRPFQRR